MTIIAAHRGGTHLWPENSRLAFRETVELGVEMVEFDLHQTADGVLVVHHDATIDRMTDGTGPIANFDYKTLCQHIIIGTNGETIPTLEETIAIFKPAGTQLRLELKSAADGSAYPGMAQNITDLLIAENLVDRTLITSFQLPLLEEFRQTLTNRDISPETLHGLMWLCSPLVIRLCGIHGTIAAMTASAITEIGLNASGLDADQIAPFAAAGIAVHAWAAHTAAAAETMFALGVASFTTDRPDLALLAKPHTTSTPSA